MQRLVDQVRPEVEQGAAALLRAVPPCQLPLTGRNRSIREVNRCTVAQRAVGDQPAHGQQVAVPPAVLVRHDDAADPGGVVDQVPRVVGGQRERFVHDDVQPRSRAWCASAAWVAVGVVIVTASHPERRADRAEPSTGGGAGQVGPHLRLPLRASR